MSDQPQRSFKDLTLVNFLQQDPVVALFVQVDREAGTVAQTTPQFWAERALLIKLSESVPVEVRDQFEAARALLVYGYFFYPLFTLAAELGLRVADSAVKHRCRQLGAPTTVKDFKKRIDWLHEQGYLSAHDFARWHDIRDQRNHILHNDKQMILAPGMAMVWLESLTEDIDQLFQGPESGGGVENAA